MSDLHHYLQFQCCWR